MPSSPALIEIFGLASRTLKSSYLPTPVDIPEEHFRNLLHDFLDQNPITADQAMDVWFRTQEATEFFAEHHPNPASRARYAAMLEEMEASMLAILRWGERKRKARGL
jgi:hypothetical protein